MKKSSTIDRPTAAADALVALLPSIGVLTASAQNAPPTGPLEVAVVASFVGEISADLAVIFTESVATAEVAGTDSQLVSIIDVLRPALEAAAATLGTGVLGVARLDDAATLFADSNTRVFALESADATVSGGWFAIRIRPSGFVASPLAGEAMVGNLGRISNVEMAMTVEIGRTRMSIRDVLGLEPGAVIELDRSAGAPADVLLNGRLIAHGEIVVVDQDYAVRITQILDVAEGLG